MKRALLLAALCVVTIVALPGSAGASHTTGGADVDAAEGIGELEHARDLVDESIELYRAGDAEGAYTAARNAYLDHFEYVEIPLRVRDGALTLEVEEDFAALRNLIEAGAPLQQVEATATELRRGMDRVERTLSSPGIAAPLIAVFYAFTIVFREGLEAVLVVAAILAYLEASRNTQYKGAILKGVGAAVLATGATFVAASLFLDIAPFQRELLEAGTALLAVAVLFYVSFWLVARLDHRRWMEFVKAKVWAAATTGSALALAGVGFTAVYREGFETVLFYQALLSFTEGLGEWVLAGSLAGVAALAAIGYLIFRAGKRIPIRTFLGTAVVLVMVMSVAFVGNAVRALQSAAAVSVTFLESLPRLPIFVAELTGLYPTRETLLAQAGLASVYLAGALWMFVIMPRRERRTRPPQSAAVTAEQTVRSETDQTSVRD